MSLNFDWTSRGVIKRGVPVFKLVFVRDLLSFCLMAILVLDETDLWADSRTVLVFLGMSIHFRN